MARKLVKFTKGWSRYNKGETAAFELQTALKLTEGKAKVAVIIDDVAEPKPTLSMAATMDTSAATKVVDDARQELQSRALKLATQAQDLARRERALIAREAQIASGADEAANTDATDSVAAIVESDASTKAPDEASANGAPPKQGAKK